MSNAKGLSELAKFVQRLKETPQRIDRALAKATKEIRELVTDEFKTQSNPWGRKWAPRKDGTSAPLLDRTGALIDATKVTYSGGTITTRVDVPYASYLQRGRTALNARGVFLAVAGGGSVAAVREAAGQKGTTAKIMRPRTIIPYRKLPPSWELALAQALETEIEK